MPIEPALQIPNTANPVCWLHNLAFNNAMANIATSDGSNKLVVATGDGALTFQNGSQAANAPFIGFKYKVTDSDGTSHDMAMVAPLTQEHGLYGSPYAVDSASTTDGGTVNLNWSGIPATLDGKSISEVYESINLCFERALNQASYARKTRQDMVFTAEGTSTAAYAYGVPSDAWYKEVLSLMALPGSTASGLLTYDSVDPDVSTVAITVTPNNNAALIASLNTQEFQLMTSQEINDWINDVWIINDSTYTNAVSIFDALGGGPLPLGSPAPSSPIWSDRSSFGGEADVVTSGFGLYRSGSEVELSLPIAAYELSGFEKAIARQAYANTAFWSTLNSHQPASTELANPDNDAQWSAATSGTVGNDGISYVKLVSLTGDTELNRCVLQCAPQLNIVSGNLLTTVLGFDASQLGSTTEGPAVVTANNAARVDRNRCVVFHAPTLAAGSYSTAGKRGGSALAMIPITAPVGDVQAWEASVPVQVPANIAGSSLSHLTVFLSNEDGERLNLLADRWSAQLILSF
jgi:hypothetical protein